MDELAAAALAMRELLHAEHSAGVKKEKRVAGLKHPNELQRVDMLLTCWGEKKERGCTTTQHTEKHKCASARVSGLFSDDGEWRAQRCWLTHLS